MRNRPKVCSTSCAITGDLPSIADPRGKVAPEGGMTVQDVGNVDDATAAIARDRPVVDVHVAVAVNVHVKVNVNVNVP